jgi:hypothetical protein
MRMEREARSVSSSRTSNGDCDASLARAGENAAGPPNNALHLARGAGKLDAALAGERERLWHGRWSAASGVCLESAKSFTHMGRRSV